MEASGLKTCRVCGKRKRLREFPRGAPRNGKRAKHGTVCRSCKRRRERQIERWYRDGRPCSRCGTVVPCPDQIGISANATCIECRRAYWRENAKRAYRRDPELNRARCRRWREKHPGAAAESTRRWRERVMSDPKRRAEINENRRIDAKLARLRQGQGVRIVSAEKYANGNGRIPHPALEEQLPVEPLRKAIKDWLREGHDQTELARRAGVLGRRVYSVLEENSATVTVHVADQLAVAIGLPISMIYRDW